MVHRWSDDDDLIGYCLYRFGPDVFGRSVEEIAGVPGMPFSSLNIKIANFKFIAGNGGLEGYSQQALAVFRQYEDVLSDDARNAGVLALHRAAGKAPSGPRISANAQEIVDLDKEMDRLMRELERLQAMKAR